MAAEFSETKPGRAGPCYDGEEARMNRRTIIRFNAVLAIICFLLGLASSASAAPHTDLYNFAGVPHDDGKNPLGSFIQVGSLLYGMTANGGEGGGTIFDFNPGNNVEGVLYSFNGLPNDGFSPNGSLVASGSTFYGMTGSGGAYNAGTVFAFNSSSNTETPLYSFGSIPNDGGGSSGSLIQIGSTLFGLTGGGSNDAGAIVSYNTVTNYESVLHSFTRGPNDGAFPGRSLIQSGTILYGLTSQGGSPGTPAGGGNGTIFAYSVTNQTESPIYSFLGGTSDGSRPDGSLLLCGTLLYGTTSEGGTNGDGTVFAYNTQTGIESLLYSFGANSNDGTDPVGSLILVGDTLYGTTENGSGSLNDGTIFSYDLSTDTESVLHSFQGTDGANPTGDLLAVGDTLYGLASNGGTHGDGVIFSVAIPKPATVTLLLAGGIGLLVHRPLRRNIPL
jgi:uncharacterized repeat protein (TIGR03803 family)